jgi:transposase-like protein
MTDLTNLIYTDAKAARKHLEGLRWADGRFCPHCGESEKTSFVRGSKHRPGLYYCNSCKMQFTVTVGTVFERSKVPLNKWLLAFHLMASSKKGISAHQLHRMLGVTYKTAWFMAHRIREAMRDGDLSPMGGSGQVVEVDETYYGNKAKLKTRTRGDGKKIKAGGFAHKHAVLTLVERGGRARSFHVQNARINTIRPIIVSNIARESRLNTDEAKVYRNIGREFKGGHGRVNHGIEEWKRGEDHTNTIEGYFSIFKRGMKGIYQHCGEQHLHRYLAEFDFRYNNRTALGVSDSERADLALKGIEGKRLTYRRPDNRANV